MNLPTPIKEHPSNLPSPLCSPALAPLVILPGVIYPRLTGVCASLRVRVRMCVCTCAYASKSPLIPFICTAGIRIEGQTEGSSCRRSSPVNVSSSPYKLTDHPCLLVSSGISGTRKILNPLNKSKSGESTGKIGRFLRFRYKEASYRCNVTVRVSM